MVFCFDAFSSRERVSTSLEYALIKVIAALDGLNAARPWTCRLPRAILTIR